MAKVLDIASPRQVKANEPFTVVVTAKGVFSPEPYTNKDSFGLEILVDDVIKHSSREAVEVGETKTFTPTIEISEVGDHRVCARAKDVWT